MPFETKLTLEERILRVANQLGKAELTAKKAKERAAKLRAKLDRLKSKLPATQAGEEAA